MRNVIMDSIEFDQNGFSIIDTVKLNDGEIIVNICYPLIYHYCQKKLLPNPTIYWIVSKKWKNKISEIEKTGKISEYQLWVQDVDNLEQFESQHNEYMETRWNLLTPEHQTYIINQGWLPKYQTGIAGIKNWSSVKCLHTNVAHYIVNKNNIIGEKVCKDYFPELII